MNIQENKSLQVLNTFHVKANARYFSQISSTQTLQKLLVDPTWHHMPKLILGGGSNILFTKNFNGLVLKNNIRGIKLTREDDQHIWLTVGAGEIWHDLVLHCLKRNYAGIENLSLIPGTVGAAPIQNIGAYGVELSSVLESLQAVNLKTGEQKKFTQPECQFGYRDSIFKHQLKNQYMITTVTFKLNKIPNLNIHYGNIKTMLDKMGIQNPNIKDISNAVISIRQEKLPNPNALPNAGSFFKNPIISKNEFEQLKIKFPDIPHFKSDDKIKIPAAWLIEQCGFKGEKKGLVGTYKNHALILVNFENATGLEIKKFSEIIQKTVSEMFDISLMTEVNTY